MPVGILVTATVAACSPQPQEPERDNLVNEAALRPQAPVIEPPFNRARLMLTVARAASSHVVAADDSETQRMLDGKRFEVRARFGCDGQGPGKGDRGWSVDPDGLTLRLRAVATLSLDDELVRQVAGDKVEAAEGFWLLRPWLLHAACPKGYPLLSSNRDTAETPPADASDEDTEPSPLQATAPQRIGIAQFFTAEDSRAGRRVNRPFEAVKRLKEGEAVGEEGFNLVVAGRLRAREDGRVILCAGAGRDRPPDCVVSADMDRVWIERPADKAVMAEWSL